ncbi:hypothetical protein EVC45_40020 [Paraburkholderia sp. UYCP14C]|uniref:hypothetical protein n=1 Tax=Paraburkholderia sp. UYCP14C TaxID=2511130 RepID=UPI00101F0685|nr:hypothetical protein [Paraburkholderia sp. UYCP14C]RZF24225.1 hypothetical protein EVC45_40020 [Paraburkholderia sp. UYCP14C]
MSNRNRVFSGLLDAAYALDEQAAGRKPMLSRVLTGAITLDTLFRRGELDADLQDAALCLERVVTVGMWHLDAGGRARAANLASITRAFANSYAGKGTSEG